MPKLGCERAQFALNWPMRTRIVYIFRLGSIRAQYARMEPARLRPRSIHMRRLRCCRAALSPEPIRAGIGSVCGGSSIVHLVTSLLVARKGAPKPPLMRSFPALTTLPGTVVPAWVLLLMRGSGTLLSYFCPFEFSCNQSCSAALNRSLVRYRQGQSSVFGEAYGPHKPTSHLSRTHIIGFRQFFCRYACARLDRSLASSSHHQYGLFMSNNNQQVLTIPAAAVDVGYFSNKFVLGSHRADSRHNELVCDSFVSVCPSVLTGNQSSESYGGIKEAEGICVKVDNVQYFVGRDANLRGDSADTRAVLPNYAASSEYRALVKGALYYIAMHNLKNYPNINKLDINVMGCGLPMTTIDSAQPDVLRAVNGIHNLPPLPGRSVDLVVNVKATMIIPQPQGALINYSTMSGSSGAIEDNLLVVDMGGGTLDWFMTVNRKRSVERSGAHQIGMLQAVRSVCESIRPGLGRDAIIVERVDKAL